jgi:hypothetical protein
MGFWDHFDYKQKGGLPFGIIEIAGVQKSPSFCSHPIRSCTMVSGKIQHTVPPKWAEFEDQILTLHTV